MIQNNHSNRLQEVPKETHLIVMGYLPIYDLGRLRSVSKLFHSIVPAHIGTELNEYWKAQTPIPGQSGGRLMGHPRLIMPFIYLGPNEAIPQIDNTRINPNRVLNIFVKNWKEICKSEQGITPQSLHYLGVLYFNQINQQYSIYANAKISNFEPEIDTFFRNLPLAWKFKL